METRLEGNFEIRFNEIRTINCEIKCKMPLKSLQKEKKKHFDKYSFVLAK